MKTIFMGETLQHLHNLGELAFVKNVLETFEKKEVESGIYFVLNEEKNV